MKFTKSMISFAIGDAIGVPVEFNSRETLNSYDEAEIMTIMYNNQTNQFEQVEQIEQSSGKSL